VQAGLPTVHSWRKGETELRKQGFVICLLTLSLSSSVVAYAQTTQTATAVSEHTSGVDSQQADKDGGQNDPGNSVDTASRTADVGTTPGTAAGKTPTPTAPASAAVVGYSFPSGGELTEHWLWDVVGPKAWVGGAFTASWKTWVDTSPTEWHRRADGWRKRFGVALIDNSINQSSLILLSTAMGQDPLYYRCACTGIWPRTKHAFKMSFVGRNHNGDAVFSPAKIIAPFTGPVVTRSTFYPDRFGPSDGLRPYYLVGSVAWNLIREFIGKSPRW
jgi:hypothetical protein